MNRTEFLILVLVIVVLAFAGMWLAWRKRARRDAALLPAGDTLTGEIVAEFSRVTYVSTTPQGAPLERLALPGLRYKGIAEVMVRRDGLTLAVTGEAPVHIAAGRISGAASGSSRAGKAVEPDGLGVLQWRLAAPAASGSDAVESGFRFDSAAAQRRFITAVNDIARGRPALLDARDRDDTQTNDTNESQEKA